MDSDNLHRRLKKIIGQVQAIDRMIDEDIPCEDILAQINAAKSALHKAGQVALEGHIKHCVRDGLEHQGGGAVCQHELTTPAQPAGGDSLPPAFFAGPLDNIYPYGYNGAVFS